MKALILLSATLVLGTVAAYIFTSKTSDIPHSDRFKIIVEGKTGYIDGNGKVVIKPTFESGQEFSEDLCAVRSNGLYGFININGDYVIKPQFEYATGFFDGAALVFTDSKPQFIDKHGVLLFKSVYKQMSHYKNGRSFVKTHSGKVGIVDKQGRLVVDTLYSRIEDFSDGLAIAYGMDHTGYDRDINEKSEVTVIDTAGNRIIPYGTYTDIAGPNEGFFRATAISKTNEGEEQVLLDLNFKIVNRIKDPGEGKYSWFSGGVYNGITRVSIPNPSDDNDQYDIYMATNGKVIFDNPDHAWCHDFSNNRAFIRKEGQDYSIINTQGKIIVDNKYKNVLLNGFRNGRAYVETESGWGVIDTSANFIVPAKYRRISEESVDSDFIFFTNGDTIRNQYEYYYGIADSKGNEIFPPKLGSFDYRGFVNGVLAAHTDGKQVYINTSGKIIWEEDVSLSSNNKSQPLNIDYMNRGYFYASSEPTGHPYEAYETGQQPITKANSFAKNTLSIVVIPERQHEKRSKIQSMTVLIANSTADTINFNAQDGRLYMKMQAMDRKGVWRDIEYLPSSWCGNSYHVTYLSPKNYWSFPAPVYEGSFKTSLRFELKVVTGKVGHRDLNNVEEEKAYYSNVFKGSINPGQLWRKESYKPNGIMDPYLE